MKHFLNQYNKDFNENIQFCKLKIDFFKNQNNECKVIEEKLGVQIQDLSLLEIFGSFSNMNLGKIIEKYSLNKEEFADKLTNMDELTKFICLKPLKQVYKAIISNQDEFERIKTTVNSIFKNGYKLQGSIKTPQEKFIETQMNSFIENL